MYRDLGPTRTLAKAAEVIGYRSPRMLNRWSPACRWQERVEAWDYHCNLNRLGEVDEKQKDQIEKYGKELDAVYEQSMKAATVLLGLSVEGIVLLQGQIKEAKDTKKIPQGLTLSALTQAISTAGRTIEGASAARGHLLGVEKILELLKGEGEQ